jgi:hypothetical protein
MPIPNRFLLRKKVFDFLAVEFQGTAEVVNDHPQEQVGNLLPKIVITPVRNASNLIVTASVNAEIRISYYAAKELELSKPNGIINRCENFMQEFLASEIMPEYSNGLLLGTYDNGYVSRIRLYTAYSVYKFFLGSERQ